ncbi:MAG: 2-phospho-L-lactate guanylyltransferase [Chloroflexi bacterium]|nr:2-phospho-L-lactate guanylyltransferase [Chloroflexota bacterium]
MAERRIWSVVVARCDLTAKSRLAPVLTDAERSQLALAMLADVLDAAGRARLAGRIAVVDTPAAQGIAAEHGALVVADPRAGMNGAVRAGVAAASRRGAQAVLVMPGDIPLVEAGDVELALEAASSARVVVVGRDRQGVGTNALLLRPPAVIRPAFGVDSARHHLYLARMAGVPTTEVSSPQLGFDVDQPPDLAELRLRRPAGATGALLGQLRDRAPVP